MLPAASGDYVLLHRLRCRAKDCHTIFYICAHCYRGQAYCAPSCRARNRLRLHREANARYQRSEAGRLDHRDRQSTYRERRRRNAAPVGVTDLSSLPSDSAPSCGHDSPAPLTPTPAAVRTLRRRPPLAGARPPLRCAVCGRPGLTVTFWRLCCRLWRLSALVHRDTP